MDLGNRLDNRLRGLLFWVMIRTRHECEDRFILLSLL